MDKKIIKKIKAVVLISVVLGVFSFGFNAGQSYPHSPVDPPSATETNITTDSIIVPGWIDVEQINASWIKTPMASESTYIVAASDSLNKEHANWVCDGTDDQVEINYALETILSGKVSLLEGQYNIGDRIIIEKDNIILEGFGEGTLINVVAGTDIGYGAYAGYIFVGNSSGVEIRNLKLDVNLVSTGETDKAGISFVRCVNSKIINCHVRELRDGGNCIALVRCNNSEISNCYVENFDDYGIAIANCNYSNAHDNVVIGTSGGEIWGIVITGGFEGDYWSNDSSITNNRVEGVNTAILLRKTVRCSVIGNNCYNFQTRGVAVAASTYALISSNNIDGNNIGWAGIQTYQRTEGATNYTCEHVNIIGNVIQRCERVELNRARGILVGNASYSSVVGNNIRNIDSDDDGVGIEIITYYVVVSGNMIVGTHDGIMMGMYSCINGNQLYSLTGDGICEGTMACGANSITGNYLRAITGTEILSVSGDNYCCVGNWLYGGTINLAGVSNTTANNEI